MPFVGCKIRHVQTINQIQTIPGIRDLICGFDFQLSPALFVESHSIPSVSPKSENPWSQHFWCLYIYAYKHPQTKDRKVNPFRSPRLSLRSGELQQGAHVGGWSRSWRAPGAAKCRGYQGINTCIYYYYTIIILYYIILYYMSIYIYIHIVGIFFFFRNMLGISFGNMFGTYVLGICWDCLGDMIDIGNTLSIGNMNAEYWGMPT